MPRRRPLIVLGATEIAAELPEGLEATGRAGTRRRPGARVYVRRELVTSPRLPGVVARVVNGLWRAHVAAAGGA